MAPLALGLHCLPTTQPTYLSFFSLPFFFSLFFPHSFFLPGVVGIYPSIHSSPRYWPKFFYFNDSCLLDSATFSWGYNYYCSHFPDEKPETQRSLTCAWSPSWLVAEQGCNPRTISFQSFLGTKGFPTPLPWHHGPHPPVNRPPPLFRAFASGPLSPPAPLTRCFLWSRRPALPGSLPPSPGNSAPVSCIRGLGTVAPDQLGPPRPPGDHLGLLGGRGGRKQRLPSPDPAQPIHEDKMSS